MGAMMTYKVEVSLNDGLGEGTPIVCAIEDLPSVLFDEITNDYGAPLPVGTTVIVTRTA